jgi:5-methyltetrahydrofolate corrinoid/iron sulfur protein methyltransferase
MAKQGGLKEDQLFVDPLVTAISTGNKNALLTFEAIRMIKQAYPEAHVTCGLSNVSFGMPLRSLINQTFMAMCIQMGLDSAIVDPNDRALASAIAAAEMLMGRDKYCQNFNRAYRAGKIGPQNNLTVGG